MLTLRKAAIVGGLGMLVLVLAVIIVFIGGEMGYVSWHWRKIRQRPPPAISPLTTAQAKEHQRTLAEYLGVEPEFTNSIAMEFVLVPDGEYEQGARDGEADSDDDERPRHRVRISREFWVGRHEVTQGQYQQLMGSNPSYFSAQGGGSARVPGLDTSRFPVESVSWFDCVAFANRLSEREGRQPYYRISNEQRNGDHITDAVVAIAGGNGYRLLTEAEWEYVARAGTVTIFPWGDSLSSAHANFDGTRPYGSFSGGDYLQRTTAVGSFPANSWGLCDTAGNVWEWVWDRYGGDEYKQFADRMAVDPDGPAQGVLRLLRGGCWYYYGHYCRPAARSFRLGPGSRFDYAGFRLALGR